MKIKIISLFPEVFNPLLKTSILKRAQEKNLCQIEVYNLRKWAQDKHSQVDDKPFGGGAGMVLKADVIDRALADLKTKESTTILLTPQGETLNQKIVRNFSKKKELILICGKYEGFDERVRKLVDIELSIGNYILTGGEVPAMAVVDSVVRLIPGVVGNRKSIKTESFSKEGQFDYPEYTKPREFSPLSKPKLDRLKVPEILLTGNHKKIKNWRKKQIEKKSK
jgi:tRNA (guanine37-N1)-methyltransferase